MKYQKKKNTVLSHIYVESKRKKKTKNILDIENKLVVARGQVVGKMGEGGQKVQTSSYKISPGDVMYSMVTIVSNTIL